MLLVQASTYLFFYNVIKLMCGGYESAARAVTDLIIKTSIQAVLAYSPDYIQKILSSG